MTVGNMLAIVGESSGDEGLTASRIATWILDWPQVKSLRYPYNQVPGVNFYEEFAASIASEHLSWRKAALVPALVAAKDPAKLSEAIELLVTAALRDVSETDNCQFLPGLVLGLLEIYPRFISHRDVDRTVLDGVVSRGLVEILSSPKLHSSHTAYWLRESNDAKKQIEGRLITAVHAWAGPGRNGGSSLQRQAIKEFMTGVKPRAGLGSSPDMIRTVVIRHVCLSAFGGLSTLLMLETLLSPAD